VSFSASCVDSWTALKKVGTWQVMISNSGDNVLHMAAVDDEHLSRLDKLTVLSRLFIAASIHLSSSYLTLFDASPRAILAPPALRTFASSLLRWDAFHFAGIAKDGYSYEHHWAFFPGVPFLLQMVDRLPTFFLDDTTSALTWVALFHALIAIPTTRAIYRLTLIHFRSPSFALLTALLSLFPASPATLYFAPYAEPIFTFLSYQGACSYLHRHTLNHRVSHRWLRVAPRIL
jgi:GPI mannosyltransferase 2